MLERITDFMSHPDLIFGQVNSIHYSEAFIDFLPQS
jgi:hypothetical protein